MTNLQNESDRNVGLDAVRSLAVGLVLLAHFVKKLESCGFWGVELFFSLSGFLIGRILWRSFEGSDVWSKERIINFWSRRWYRTLPNYFLFFIVEVGIRLSLNMQLPNFRQLAPFFVFGQDFIARNGQFFGVSWSLCVEEWFYLLFPMLIFLAGRIFKGRATSFVFGIVIMAAGSIFMRNYLLGEGVGVSLRAITMARLDAIVYGVAVAFVFKAVTGRSEQVRRKNVRNFALGAFLSGGVLSVVALSKMYFADQSYPQTNSSNFILTIVPLSLALILPAISMTTSLAKLPSLYKTIIRNGSLWSYSIYLSHIPVLLLTYSLLEPVRNNIAGNVLSKIVGVVMTVFLSKIIYEKFEKKITNMRPAEMKRDFA